jgi:hypothetical protein
MSEHFENRKNEVALRRFAAVSFIEQKLREVLAWSKPSAWPRCVRGPTKMDAFRRHAPWKITGMPGKAEVSPPFNPKAVVIKGFSQAAGRSRSMALEPSKSVSRDRLRALDCKPVNNCPRFEPSTGTFAPKVMTRLRCGADGWKPDRPRPLRHPL